jgi:hypothetical protein
MRYHNKKLKNWVELIQNLILINPYMKVCSKKSIIFSNLCINIRTIKMNNNIFGITFISSNISAYIL